MMHWRETSDRLVDTLVQTAPERAEAVSFDDLDRLPRPVSRYLRAVLREGEPLVRLARFTQTGTLCTNESKDKWSPFEARQIATPTLPGFVWDAKIRLAPLIHVQVRDAYVGGTASGQVSLLSVIPLDRAEGGAELNAGALHRFLAEAVWYPTALLPRPGLSWTPIDEHRALATLADHGTTVSLEFRFNDADEVSAVYAPGRYRKVGRRYELTPWEGHFSKYEERNRMRVPLYGEVGWYLSGGWRPAWEGRVTEIEYE
jgi:hypothetical protein